MLDRLDRIYWPSLSARRSELYDALMSLEFTGDAVDYITQHTYLLHKLITAGYMVSLGLGVTTFLRGTRRKLPEWFGMQCRYRERPHPPNLDQIQDDLLKETSSPTLSGTDDKPANEPDDCTHSGISSGSSYLSTSPSRTGYCISKRG